MRAYATSVLVFALGAGIAPPVLAQRLPFERSFDVTGAPKLDVSTLRGTIDVTIGDPGRVVVAGAVTVRIGWDVPADAVDIARRIADHPPIERDGQVIRLRPPADSADRRAVTVNYRVQVPPETDVLAVSDSGATTIRGVAGPVSVRTQSGAIELNQLGGTTAVTTGSGAVTADGVGGALTVTTSSSAITGGSLRGHVRVRTNSGAVDLRVTGPGDVDVETHSSAIKVHGVRGGLTAVTESGHVSVEGAPGAPWKTSTGSGGVELSLASAAFTVEAMTGSGSVKVEGAPVQGSVSNRKVTGTVGRGGPQVSVSSRSGSIRLTVR